MKAKAISKHVGAALCALSMAVMLSSCAGISEMFGTGESSSVSTSQAFSPLTGTLAQYRQLQSSAGGSNAFPASLLLARALIVSGEHDEAQALLNNLKQQAVTPLERDEASIIQALLYSQQGRSQEAYALLGTVNEMTLPPQAAGYYYQLISNTEVKLYQSTREQYYLQQAFNHKRTLVNQLSGQDKRTVMNQCLDLLKRLSPSELAALLQSTSDTESRGYIEYAIIDASQNQNLKQQLFVAWEEKYGSHPLNQLRRPATAQPGTPAVIPGGEAPAVSVSAGTAAAVGSGSSYTPIQGSYYQLQEGDRVAVLLPLTGRFAAGVGEPARLGIISALQDRSIKLNVVFYDTNRLTMEEIARSLKQTGTSYILGPVLRPEVDALLSYNLNIPVVMLNNPGRPLGHDQWYFNLGPDYEGALAASKIAQSGNRSPLIISTGTSKAERSVQGFNQNWQRVQGRQAARCSVASDSTISLGHCPVSSADAVYIAAGPVDSARIKQALPAAMPAYITDQSFNGVNSSPNEALLVGAQLGDMPWVITDSALKNSFMRNIPKADSQAQRIFAAAHDSLHFALNVNRLAQNRSDVLHGLSGDIQLGADGLIETAPLWITIEFPRLQQATGAQSPGNR